MPIGRGCIAHPWILGLVNSYGQSEKPKAMAAKVVKFITTENDQSDNSLNPAAVVFISDRKSWIQAIITYKAKKKLEEEEEHFTLEDINGKIIILKEFAVLFRQEDALIDCGFYIRIEHFHILPMEPDREDDGINCNEDPSVKLKIKEQWQKFRNEMEMQDSPEASLTQLVDAVNEERFKDLESTAYTCLNLRSISPLPSTHSQMTAWKTCKKRKKTDKDVFSVPINWLMISHEEEVALANLQEWKYDYPVTNDNDEPAPSLEDVLSRLPSNEAETLANLQESRVTLRIEEDNPTQPDSSTPDFFEIMEGRLQENMDISPPLFFSGSSDLGQETFNDANAIMCDTVTWIDSTTDSIFPCGQESKNEKDNSAYHLNVPSSLSSQIPRLLVTQNVVDVEYQNRVLVNEQEKSVSRTLFSDVVMDPLDAPHSAGIRNEAKEQIGEKSFEESLKPQATMRTRPKETLTKNTTFIEDSPMTGIQSCAKKKPKMDANSIIVKDCMKTRPRPYKPKLQFLSIQNNQAEQETDTITNSTLLEGIQAKAPGSCQEKQNATLKENGQERLDTCLPTLQRTNNMRHFDGSRLQYKYKAANSDLCKRARSARLSADLLEWAYSVIFETN
ncbi:adrenocortical dysplasia protein homolog isoform X2 [Ambystoma mexicanum]|uniref:adrenocortical dysplasia protein homolog isoform X2 n=1 Tax=Ambystoma mexicanum TaxID=8296 RepID=UPI0037E8AE52